SWTDNANNENGFKIERSTDGVNFALITTTAANITSYIDTSLAAGTTYTYQLLAPNAAGDSSSSTAVAATTPVPAAPATTDITLGTGGTKFVRFSDADG